jgi:hypothetical protein
MKTKRKQKLKEETFFVGDEVGELKAEIARLRGALRAVEKLSKVHLIMTPSYMLKLEGE